MRKYIIYAILVLININYCFSSEDYKPDTLRAGLFTDFNYSFHSSDFRELPGIPNCCPRFTGGSGAGFNIGAFYEHPLNPKLSLLGRLSFSIYGTGMESLEDSKVTINGQPVDAKINHTLDASFSFITLEPLAKYNVLKSLNALGGFFFGIKTGSSFQQEEILTEPAAGTFENGLRVRNKQSGSIAEASSMSIGLTIGANYELPLNKEGSLTLFPEILFSQSFNSPVKGLSWSYNAIRVGASLRYYFIKVPEKPLEFKKKEIIDTIEWENPVEGEASFAIGKEIVSVDTTEYPDRVEITRHFQRTDTLFKAVYRIKSTVEAVGYDGQKEYPGKNLKIEEIMLLNFRPLLNYIFFDENSSKIPPRYVRRTFKNNESFNEQGMLKYETLQTYYEILNIIGSRMHKYPKAKITLTGCNSGYDGEKNNKILSRDRARSVMNYLTGEWDIDSSRITIVARDLPKMASNSSDEDGRAENRRVEISSDTPEITRPVITNDTLRLAYPPEILFKIQVNKPDKVKSWVLRALQGSRLLKEFNGHGEVPDRLVWNINEEKETIPPSTGPIEYYLETTDLNGDYATSAIGNIYQERSKQTKHLDKRVANKIIENFSLILFEFDKEKMNKQNMQILDYIKTRLRDSSIVTIEGYTDRIGDEAYNQKLSELRAESVKKILGAKNSKARGFGEINPLYNNNLPEGRFYNRTVLIIVETSLHHHDEE